jgi:hypothetical protein
VWVRVRVRVRMMLRVRVRMKMSHAPLLRMSVRAHGQQRDSSGGPR